LNGRIWRVSVIRQARTLWSKQWSYGSTEAGVRGWLRRRRDRPGGFAITSTKVQSFDDAITGTKRAQSLNSGNRTIRGRKCPKSALRPRTAEQETLLRTTSDHRNIAGLGIEALAFGGRYAVAGVGRHPDICQPRNRRTIILHRTGAQSPRKKVRWCFVSLARLGHNAACDRLTISSSR
jgi:hypothetical protein